MERISLGIPPGAINEWSVEQLRSSRLTWHTTHSLLALRHSRADQPFRQGFGAHAYAQRRAVCLRQLSFLYLIIIVVDLC